MKTRTVEEAALVLKAYRRRQITTGELVTIKLCHENGTTTSSAMLDEMVTQGLFDTRINNHWAGMVYRKNPMFEVDGWVFPPLPEKSRSHTPHLMYRWRLAPGVVHDQAVYDAMVREQRAALMNGTGIPPFLLRFKKYPGQTMADLLLDILTLHQTGRWWYVSFDELSDAELDAEKFRSGVDWQPLLEELIVIHVRGYRKALEAAEIVITRFIARNYY